jgi:hypothetical protein
MLIAGLTLGFPAVVRVSAPAALVLFVVGAGSAAGDAFPWRPAALVCSVLTMAVGAAALTRMAPATAAGALALALQLAPRVAGR